MSDGEIEVFVMEDGGHDDAIRKLFPKYRVRTYNDDKFPGDLYESPSPVLWITNSMVAFSSPKVVSSTIENYLSQNIGSDVLYMASYGDQCNLHSKVYEYGNTRFHTSYKPKGLMAVLFVSEKSKKVLKEIVDFWEKGECIEGEEERKSILTSSAKTHETIMENYVYEGKLKAHGVYPPVFFYDYQRFGKSIRDLIKINPCQIEMGRDAGEIEQQNEGQNAYLYTMGIIFLIVGLGGGLYYAAGSHKKERRNIQSRQSETSQQSQNKQENNLTDA